ncbi:MAG TPA: [LysW]-lysine hydrolase [Candidatus Limnocylindrales bacterium]|nr:[LysW]-lysine hydrolase [Candidatus Limnocylindrales bacterium]
MVTARSAGVLLEEMLQIPSVTGDEERVAAWLTGRLRDLDFEATRDQAGNVIATWGSGPSEVVLLGHIDTVPGAIPVRRDNDRLFGRGAVDAKGPLAAAITAVARRPKQGAVRYTVIGAVEEEGSSRGAYHLQTGGRRAPAHLIVLEPSGWDAITLGYKGSLQFTYRLRQAMAHGSAPSPSASDQAVAFLRTLQDHAAMVSLGKPAFDRLDVRVLEMAGKPVDGLQESATVRVSLRLPVEIEIVELKEFIRGWAEGATVDFGTPVPAYRAEKNTALVRAFLHAIRGAQGTPRFKVKSGTSDMNILAPVWQCPAVAYGPGDSHLDHTPDEAIDLDELERGVSVLTAVLDQLT